MKKIYVVMGATGEYSDHNEWMVKAFSHKKKAQEFVIAVSQAAAVAMGLTPSDFKEGEEIGGNVDWDNRNEASNPLDRNMHISYTGVRYLLYEVDFEG